MRQLPAPLREALSGHGAFPDAAAVRRAAERLDPELLRALLASPGLRRRLFTDVDGVAVFDRAAFTALLDGVTGPNDGVRLIWPDAGARSSVGATTARLANARRHTADRVETVRHADDGDNLLVKGENLKVLGSLLPLLHGGVRLIYIDPPYNTGNSALPYEDRLTRPEWLTFMRDRAEVAAQLLTSDGVLLIQCSSHQAAHLEVMLEGVDQLHKVMVFHTLVRHPDRALTAGKQFNDVVEQILVFARDRHFRMPRRTRPRRLDDYRWQIEVTGPGRPMQLGGRACTVFPGGEWTRRAAEPGADNLRSHSIRGSLREKNSSGRFYVAHIEPLAAQLGPGTLVRVPDIGDDGLGHRFFHTPRTGTKNGTYFQGVPQSTAATTLPHPNFLDFHGEFNRVAAEGGVDFRNGKKPEALLKFLLEIFTEPGDTVLDYHLGSGTTAAVAHKLGRRWVGIEKMDFIETVTLRRLCGVLAGEQSGISGEVGWAGGGGFVYAELN